MEFIDTNVFVRLLVCDDEMKYMDCLAFFERIEDGNLQVATSEAIVAEIMFVLTSRATYRLAPHQASFLIRPLLELPGVRIDHKQSVLRALDLFARSSVDFEDCLVAAHAERLGADHIVSYDRSFHRITSIPRIEPPPRP